MHVFIQSPPPRRASLSPSHNSSPNSRLMKPTVSSRHNMWPNSPDAPRSPKEDRKPQLIKSKKYENVGSRLFNPTVASASKFTADSEEDDSVPKEAFGHPIEPGYVKLVRPRRSSSPNSKPRRRSTSPNGKQMSPGTENGSASMSTADDISTMTNGHSEPAADDISTMTNGHSEPVDGVM
jgi:hypothetical protein